MKGTKTRDRHRAEASRSITLLKWEGVQSVLFALLYLVLRRLIGFAEGSKEDQSKDVEILVLRHQLKVLRRQAGRPPLRRFDRAFLAAASRALPRPAWASFVVSPQLDDVAGERTVGVAISRVTA